MGEHGTAEWEARTEGRWGVVNPPATVAGFHFDTRELKPGEVFLAWRGEARDGHDFLGAARAAGAAAAIVERTDPEVPLPQLQVDGTLAALHRIAGAHRARFTAPVAAITGSYGKTSTKEMLARILGVDTTAATSGNWNNHIGVPLTLLGIDPEWHRHAVIEAGISLPGEMAPLGALIAADTVLFTGIGSAHLEALGSREAIALEKWQLAAKANPAARLYFPASCLRFSPFAGAAREERATVLAEEGTPEVSAVRCIRYRLERTGASAIRVTLPDAEGEGAVRPPLVFTLATASCGMAANAALAAAAARGLGIADADIAARIEGWRAGKIRGGWRAAHGVQYYVDCYNANPDALADALDAFDAATASLPPETARVLVLGTMLELGPEAAELHRLALAAHRPRAADRYLLVGEAALTDAYATALGERGVAADRIEHFAQTPEHPPYAFGPGPVFLKGSRRHALERWVPDLSATT